MTIQNQIMNLPAFFWGLPFPLLVFGCFSFILGFFKGFLFKSGELAFLLAEEITLFSVIRLASLISVFL